KEFFGWDPGLSFFVPEEVKIHLLEPGLRGAQRQAAWQDLAGAYRRDHPEPGDQLWQAQQGELPPGWDSDLPTFAPGEALATRQASGKTLAALRQRVPWIIGGSADLASSNDMPTQGELSFQPGHYENSNIWFGVREHGMGAILNGMAAHRGLRVFGGTFLTFSDYMRGAIRLAALTQAPVTYVFTHDSVGLGEDGPTHQPVEQVMALRAIPNLTVIRPADAYETVAAWRLALQRQQGPVALILTRQKVPVIDQERYAPAHLLERGGYVLSEASGPPQLILMATGSEVHLALGAQQVLEAEGMAVRVVSLPSWELFDSQDQAYRDSVLPPALTRRLAIEAGVSLGWHRYLPDGGEVLGIDRFGASAPGEQVLEALGFTIENVCRLARSLADKKTG
ncbi:MAG: transketolase-like TK C-terminal-containing protein, partial [Adhaeribacter sp.]